MNNINHYDGCDEVVKDYSYLVNKIASHVILKVPDVIQYDDLVQAGMIGLIEAFQRFDEKKGASFITYAGIRIRGAMIDEIRKGDWTPRSVYKKSRELYKQSAKLEHELGRAPTDRELALYLQISLGEYHLLLNSIKTHTLLIYEEGGGICEELITSYFLIKGNNPIDSVHIAHLLEKVKKEIKFLPKHEFKVFSFYYDNEMSLREIGQILGLSESRVSQIHTQALMRLQRKISL